MNTKPKESSGERSVIRALNPETMLQLKVALRERCGDDADNLTVDEVLKKHSDLLDQLDGERIIEGVSVSDAQMADLTYTIDVNKALKGARAQLGQAVGKKKS